MAQSSARAVAEHLCRDLCKPHACTSTLPLNGGVGV
jgi:hypothetical protein